MSKYYYLKEGDTIQDGDEVEMSNDIHAVAKWVPANCIGQKAHDPNYPSHRMYRRLLLPTQDQFNSIKDLRPYFLLHPDADMVTDSCLHFLGDEAQKWWSSRII